MNGDDVKHVVGTALKSALKWGLIAGAVFAAVPAISLIVGGSIPMGIASMFSAHAAAAMGTGIAAAIFHAAIPGLILGGALGGVMGAAKGVSTAREAADERESAVMDNQERRAALAERQMALTDARQSAMGGGVSPGGMPMGRGMGGQQIG